MSGRQTKGTAEKAVLVGVEFSCRKVASKTTEAKRALQAAGANPETLDEILGERALLGEESASVYPVKGDPEDERFEEFRELVESAGATVVAEILQRRQAPDPATLIGAGKVEEVGGAAASTNATVIVFDYDLSPTQLRNLEARLPCRVIDRTQLILDIFARHARTREGQLQVELAQLEYMLPRLTGKGKAMSQLGGGIGTRGPGETRLETDRRKIQRRLLQLRRDLDDVRKTRRLQRARRESVPVPTVALVGYTNAGKSTLFNCLTQAGVLESSRMFATLDPKLRSLVLPSRRKVLLSDTVGFIRDLPHTLVTSFRATLEEVVQAELLLHVRDAASPRSEEQKHQVRQVLGELEVTGKPMLEVMNKADLLSEADRSALRRRGELLVSGLTGEGAEELLLAMDRALTSDPVRSAELLIPQSEGSVLAAIVAGAVVEERRYAGEAVLLRVTAPESLLGRLREFEVGYVPVVVERPKRRVQKAAKPEATDAEV